MIIKRPSNTNRLQKKSAECVFILRHSWKLHFYSCINVFHRFWESLSSDVVRPVVLRVLCPGGHPHVWHTARWSGRPHGHSAEKSCGQD